MPASGLCDAIVAITPTTSSEIPNSSRICIPTANDAISSTQSVRQSERNQDGILELLDTYILSLARRYVPRSFVPIVDLAISELAQNTRIKLWLALCREPLTNPRAYVRRVVLTECADMIQRYRPLRALPMNEDGELEQDHLCSSEGQQWHDPADEFEQQEAMIDCMHEAVEKVLALSPRQQQAMMWALQSCDVDIRLLRTVFLERGLDIAAINTPDDAVELQRWRASLSAARKKLRSRQQTAV